MEIPLLQQELDGGEVDFREVLSMRLESFIELRFFCLFYHQRIFKIVGIYIIPEGSPPTSVSTDQWREEEALFEHSKDGELAAKHQELPVELVLEYSSTL